jgi:hypothetical protein
MKRYLELAKRFLLLTTSFMTTSVLSTSSTQAATLAFSRNELNLRNFSTNFSIIQRINNGDTDVFADGGVVTVDNNAVTDFTENPFTAFTSGFSSASGESKDYTGLAETESKIITNFDVGANQHFSFDFTAILDLKTSIEEPPVENARARGDVSFLLLDTSDIAKQNLSDFLTSLLSNTDNIHKIPLEFLAVNGNLNTLGENDFIIPRRSSNVTLINKRNESSFYGKQDLASVVFEGSLKRYFDKPANLTLVALRRSQARVTAPEAATNLALLGTGAFLAATAKMSKRKSASSEHSIEMKETLGR